MSLIPYSKVPLRTRQPWDERLPDGRSVDEAVQSYALPQPYSEDQQADDQDQDVQPPPAIDPALRNAAFTPPVVDPSADYIAQQQARPQMDYRPGIDDVQVLPSGKVVPRSGGAALQQQPQTPTRGTWGGTSTVPVQQPSTPSPTPVTPVDNSADAVVPPTTPPPPEYKPKLPGMAAPPIMIAKDRYGRPTGAVGGDTDIDRTQAQISAVAAYKPTKAHGWNRYLPAIQMGAEAGRSAYAKQPGNADLFATAGGALGGLLRGAIDPKTTNRQWQASQTSQLNDQLDTQLKQGEKQSQIENYKSLGAARDDAQQAREDRIKIAQDRLTETQRQHALNVYNTMDHDYEPGKEPFYDNMFKNALGTLPPARKAKDPTQLIWSNGQPLIVGKTSGQARAVTQDGKTVVDVQRQATMQPVTIGGKSQQMLVTPAEQLRASQEEAKRVQQAKIAATNEKGRNARAAQRQQGAMAPAAHQALMMLNQYRNLGVQAQRAEYNQDMTTAATLRKNQKATAEQIKTLYPNEVDWSVGEPRLRVPWSRSQYEQKYKAKDPKANTEPNEAQALAESQGYTIVP